MRTAVRRLARAVHDRRRTVATLAALLALATLAYFPTDHPPTQMPGPGAAVSNPDWVVTSPDGRHRLVSVDTDPLDIQRHAPIRATVRLGSRYERRFDDERDAMPRQALLTNDRAIVLTCRGLPPSALIVVAANGLSAEWHAPSKAASATWLRGHHLAADGQRLSIWLADEPGSLGRRDINLLTGASERHVRWTRWAAARVALAIALFWLALCVLVARPRHGVVDLLVAGGLLVVCLWPVLARADWLHP